MAVLLQKKPELYRNRNQLIECDPSVRGLLDIRPQCTSRRGSGYPAHSSLLKSPFCCSWRGTGPTSPPIACTSTIGSAPNAPPRRSNSTSKGARVVPLIVTRGPDRVAFATDVRQDSTVRVGLRPAGPTTYAIEWRRGASRRVLAQGAVDGPLSIVCAYPTGTGVLELVSGGPSRGRMPASFATCVCGRHVCGPRSLDRCAGWCGRAARRRIDRPRS